jgi:hypothetical protein
MKRILLAFCLTMIFGVEAFGFPIMADDSWNVPTQTNTVVMTSQITLTYDPIGNKAYIWQGHLPFGGYPQVEDIMSTTFNSNNTITFADLRPINSDMPAGS